MPTFARTGDINFFTDAAFMYYINDGLYGAFSCLYYDHAEVEPTLLKVILAMQIIT